MKKIIAIILLIITILFTGCAKKQEVIYTTQHEFYNKSDERDFFNPDYYVLKFDIVQFKQNAFISNIKDSDLNSVFFLGIGNVKYKSEEKTIMERMYCGYVKNKYGANYIFFIPVNKCRIYEDANNKPCIVGYTNGNYQTTVIETKQNNNTIINRSVIATNSENLWKEYEFFNIHVPQNTIIPYIGEISIDNLVK